MLSKSELQKLINEQYGTVYVERPGSAIQNQQKDKDKTEAEDFAEMCKRIKEIQEQNSHQPKICPHCGHSSGLFSPPIAPYRPRPEEPKFYRENMSCMKPLDV